MCGIIFSKNIDNELFQKSFDLMNYRGPDEDRIETYNEYTLGHKRLSIVDLNSRSSQPFLASDNKTAIIFNGEIYNYKELKSEYGIETKTTSDTEVLVELYLKLGEKCLDKLNGMFAFVIFNTETKDYFIARDRLGIKPLYYYDDGKKFTFCSEVAPILNITDADDFDVIGARQYLKLRAFFRGHTLYKSIKSFPAGHFLKNGRLQKYWSLEDSHNEVWNDDEVKELINSSILYRKVADVETGSYLSGGIDSSIVAAVADKEHTWTVGFEKFNEFEYARIVADKYNFKHHEVLISKEEYNDIATEMINIRKEPLSVPNEVLLYKMTKEVKKYNTVVLSGEGADELFFGYDRIFRWASENEFNLREFDKAYSYGTHQDDEILEYVLEPVSHIKENLAKVATFFQLYHLHGLLRRLDFATMLCSVEARVPFVDHRLIEYMYNAPFDYRMQDGVVKAPLKRIYENILPSEVVNRKKVGFPVPVEEIYSNDKTGIDGWLRFNLETVSKEKWSDLKSELLLR